MTTQKVYYNFFLPIFFIKFSGSQTFFGTLYTDRHKKRLIMISLINDLEYLCLFFFIIDKLGYFQ
jgi:hypothetical protein